MSDPFSPERFRSPEMLQGIIEAVPLAITGLNPQAQVIIWNPAAEKLFGWTQQEVAGKALPIIPPEKVEEFRLLFEQELQGARTVERRVQRKRRDGTLLELNLNTFPLYDQEGRIVSIMGIFTDLTEKFRLEEQLRQSQKIEAVGRLAGGVAHDFNNLITAIIGYSDLALHYIDNREQVRKKLEEVKKAANRATNMTRQLLAYSRKQLIQPKNINLNAIIQDMQKMLRQLIGEDIDIVFSLEHSLGGILADTGQMEQMILNLLVNARDAMPQGGNITITTKNVQLDEHHARQYVDLVPGNYVMFSIKDTGTGMSEEIQKKIFEPFFTTKPVGMGTGLGLSSVYGIVKQSEGHITVWSKPGQGTLFTIYLPRTIPAVVPEKPVPSSSPLPRGSETILVVDDDENIRNLVSETLVECGYHILSAQHGGEALLICQQYQEPIHLMISDVVMPHVSGRVLAEKLSILQPSIKMLFMSGYTDDVLVRHIVLDANPLFLEKPFTMETLAIKVREVLDEPSEG